MMRINIVSGLLLFSISIVLGPYMMGTLQEEESFVSAQTELREAFGDIRTTHEPLRDRTDEETGETVAAAFDLADVGAATVAAGRAARAHVNWQFTNFRRDNIAFTHAHGNLQGMLNILVGLFLGYLAVPVIARYLISLGFIVGSWWMVGALFLGNLMGQTWALQHMIWGGRILIATLFTLTVVVIWKGFEKPA